ncbi:HoxN/HupN/NixA family nickel/cobalt transporter, partial [Mycobacteroides abscessus subsp. abscessus]|nr:HoxN/HupN/NixA family nickel/cobalt transporter [Mycobacteroides abscessus subsp. abscessus]
GLSVAVAVLIGSQEIISILTEKLDITSGPLAAVGELDLAAMGYVIVALFIVTWAAAALGWRYTGVRRRWGG